MQELLIINMQTMLISESLLRVVSAYGSKQAYLELKGTAVARAFRSTCICA